jgi:ATP-binding cassette subfamily F protein uup
MSVLGAQGLVKSYGSRSVLDGIDCAIEEGERVGLVGRNGSGKSTLARALGGIEPIDGGTIARQRGASILYLEQDPKLDADLTARQTVLAGLTAWSAAKARHEQASHDLASGTGDTDALLHAQHDAALDVERLGGWDLSHEVDAVLGHVGVTKLDAPVGTLSGGDRRRVALARLLVARPALAILDEPSNHLDADTVAWLETYLVDEFKGAVLLITHDRYLLDRVVTRTLEIDRGKIYAFDGGYESYLEQKAVRQDHEQRTEENRQNFLRTELEWLRRQPKARSTKQKARIQRAESAIGVNAPVVEQTAQLQLDAVRTGKTILDLRGLSVDLGGRRLVRSLDLSLVPGERVGVVGKNGAGKTSLLRAVLGDLPPATGEIVIGKNTRFAYLDQHRAGLDEARTIAENVSDKGARIAIGGEILDVRTYLERFLFDPYMQRQPVASLSGGERARVALAKALAHGANLVVLDEPTNDLDLPTLAALETLLVSFGGAALVVTHDRWFLDRVATSILAFEGDGEVVRYAGNYTTYREHRARAEEEKAALAEAAKAAAAKPVAVAAKTASAPPPAKKGLTYAEKKELDGLMDKVEAADAAVAELETKLADPSLYADRGSDVPKLQIELDKRRVEAKRLMDRWEELESKKG